MARYVARVDTVEDPAVVFDYLANFESIVEWDPGVRSAGRRDKGELGVGSSFDVETVNGLVRIPLVYEVTAFEPGHSITLVADNGRFRSFDVISVEPSETGCTVTYDAELTMHGLLGIFDPLLALSFQVIGRRAENGLRRAVQRVEEVAA